MKTKRKEKVKQEENKRKETKRLCLESNKGPSMYRPEALPLGYVEHTTWFVEILLLKPLSLI